MVCTQRSHVNAELKNYVFFSEGFLMDDPLQKALGSLHQSITKRSRKSAAITSNDEEDKLFKTQSPDPSPRDQQDLMAFPFFSLEKHKRTKPIEYEQGSVKVEVDGLSKTGIAIIWDAALLNI